MLFKFENNTFSLILLSKWTTFLNSTYLKIVEKHTFQKMKKFRFFHYRTTLRGTRKSNIDKLIFGHLNINSLRNTFDILSKMIKGFVKVFMISQTKLDDRFPGGQFYIEGYQTIFRLDRNGNGGGILLYVPEDIPTKYVVHCDFPTCESFYVEINLHKKKWLLNCSYNLHKNNNCNHFFHITNMYTTKEQKEK